MKILVYRWDIYPYENIIKTLKKQGHLVDVLAFPISNHISDPEFSPILKKWLREHACDLVFSVNFYAVIAEICFQEHVRYAAWTCDTPLLSMLHPSVQYPTSHVFTFDRAEYQKFHRQGLTRIHYLPLAGMEDGSNQPHPSPNAAIPANARPASSPDSLSVPDYLYDISFVGSLYEKNRYEDMCLALPDRLRGYMDAILEAGRHISGGDFISRMLSEDILSEISPYVSLEGETLSEEALRIHFETAVLSYKIAADTRLNALWYLSQSHPVDLFTSTPPDHPIMEDYDLANLSLHPPVDYQQELPRIFRLSKINLNFTIPNITDGTPLRILDILSCGGFLLTDHRDALEDMFQDGVDLVIFHGMEDMMKKAGYYLSHPAEREAIARQGMAKVRSLHTYDIRLTELIRKLS